MVKIQIILGSTRPNRRSEMVGKWVLEQIKQNPEVEAELIDLRDWPLPFYNEISGPSGLHGNFSVEIAKKWGEQVNKADGYIIITPEYNHGYPAVLKNALDYAYAEWNNKPVAFVSYGGMVGGARSVEQLRLVSIELQMVPIREAVYFTKIREAFNEAGQPRDEKASGRLNNLINQLLWWAETLKTGRTKNPPLF